MDTAATPGQTTSRRTLLTTGTAGLAAAAFLAACSDGQDVPEPGLSGAPTSTAPVPPTVPDKEPTQAELQVDLDTLATANSIELLAADVYRRFGTRFSDPELQAAAERFASDHEAAAEVFGADVQDHDGVGEPNEYLLTNMVEPIENLLTDDAAIANLAADIERAIAATYITAVGTLLDADWRMIMMEHGAAAARRSTVLDNGGTGSTPTTALFPMTDLISTDAYLSTAAAEEAAAEAAAAEGSGEGTSEGGASGEGGDGSGSGAAGEGSADASGN